MVKVLSLSELEGKTRGRWQRRENARLDLWFRFLLVEISHDCSDCLKHVAVFRNYCKAL